MPHAEAPGISGQPAKKGSNHSFELVGLIERKSVTGVWDLLDTDPRVDVAEPSGEFERDDR
jgi:hypothetical protein